MSQTMTPTAHERAEWSRLSVDCQKHKRQDAARFFERLSLSTEPVPVETFDRAQRYYRGWLISGFPKD